MAYTSTSNNPGHAHEHDDHKPTGLKRWLFATNHKDIGTMYLVFACIMFFTGGAMALVIRLELFELFRKLRIRCVQRGEAVLLDQRIAFPVVVVQVAVHRRVEQAAKVVEAMPIVSADGGVEGDGHFLRVGLVADSSQ